MSCASSWVGAVPLKEAGKVEEKAANRVAVTEEGDSKGGEMDGGRISITPVLYQRGSIVVEELSGILHGWGGPPLEEGVPGMGGSVGCGRIGVGERSEVEH